MNGNLFDHKAQKSIVRIVWATSILTIALLVTTLVILLQIVQDNRDVLLTICDSIEKHRVASQITHNQDRTSSPVDQCNKALEEGGFDVPTRPSD